MNNTAEIIGIIYADNNKFLNNILFNHLNL